MTAFVWLKSMTAFVWLKSMTAFVWLKSMSAFVWLKSMTAFVWLKSMTAFVWLKSMTAFVWLKSMTAFVWLKKLWVALDLDSLRDFLISGSMIIIIDREYEDNSQGICHNFSQPIDHWRRKPANFFGQLSKLER
jgi:hypothetical protein